MLSRDIKCLPRCSWLKIALQRSESAKTGYLARHPTPSEEELRDVVGGHLCRCTGYAPIIAAALDAAATLRREAAHA